MGKGHCCCVPKEGCKTRCKDGVSTSEGAGTGVELAWMRRRGYCGCYENGEGMEVACVLRGKEHGTIRTVGVGSALLQQVQRCELRFRCGISKTWEGGWTESWDLDFRKM